MSDEIRDFIRLSSLENAVNFKGQANPKALIGKVLGKYPDMKSDMKTLMTSINEIVSEVNSLDLEQQTEELKNKNPQFFSKEKKSKDEVKGLKDLEGHSGPIRTRFPPAPSGHLHLGHLFGIIFNYEYVQKYGGEFVVRLEDTNPENISLDNYDKMVEDIKWITDDGISELYYQSDRVELYYEYLEKLIEQGDAYVCECDAESFKKCNDSSTACPHRENSISEQKKRYEKFFNGEYKDGDAIVRFKADLNNKNPALRDFPLARMKSDKHVRVGDKYKLWPMYVLCAGLDDSLMNISYIIRGKDIEISGVRQDMIKDALKLKKSPYYHFGKMNFTDLTLSKTQLTQKIKDGEYDGWDDPRIATIVSYRRRGYRAKAFRNLYVQLGMSKRDSTISSAEFHKNLDYHNKQIIEKDSNRYFCVYDKVDLIITNVSDIDFKEVLVAKHPDDESKGLRTLTVESDNYIDRNDFERFEVGDTLRLMHYGNFKVVSKEDSKIEVEFVSKDYDKNLKLKGNIHYVPKSNAGECVVVTHENEKINGVIEELPELDIDTSVQFERLGFARFDSYESKTPVFYFTHR